MEKISQSPTDPSFVQNPYVFYKNMLTKSGPVFWQEYDMAAVFDYATVSALLKDKRLGREIPADMAFPPAPHLAPFYDVEAHSMLNWNPRVTHVCDPWFCVRLHRGGLANFDQKSMRSVTN